MHHGEINNSMCLLQTLVCLENFNIWMNSPNIIKSEWMFVQSKQKTVGDKKMVGKYYGIIK